MAYSDAPVPQFDPEGMRRMIVRTLRVDKPASREEAETLILGRFGPYLAEEGVVRAAITAHFTADH